MLMATMLARMPDLRERVQADHIADSSGHCQDCQAGTAWPCELYWIAQEAENIYAAGSDDSQTALPTPRKA